MEKKLTEGLSRRGFLQLGAVGAAGLAGFGMTGCSPTAESAQKGASEKASGWRTPPEAIAESDIAQKLEADVVVVGAGNAGVFAACSAAESGASVVMIERTETVGTARHWMGALGSRAAIESGKAPNADDVVFEACRYSDFKAKQALVKQWALHSGETMDWIEDVMAGEIEVRFQWDVNEGAHFKEYPLQHSVHDAKTGDRPENLLALLLGKFPEIDARYSTSLQYLTTDESGKVTGVVAEGPDGFIEIEAKKGVILCAGGYCGNQEMLSEINPEVADNIVQIIGLPQNTGDGIKAGVWAGAAKDEAATAMVFDRGVALPGETGGEPYSEVGWGPGFVFGSQPFMIVNKGGERFVNESIPYDYKAHAAWQQEGSVWIEVWDSKWVEDVTRFNTIGCSRIAPAPNDAMGGIFPVPGIQQYIDSMVEAGACVTADTVEGLAEAIGLPSDVFAKTVERYNELYEKGSDDDFGKEAYRLSSISEPPFYAITLGGQVLCTLDGLSTDENGAVLNENGKAIEGLWAAGNNAGGFFAGNYPELLVGMSVGRAVTMGRLIGKTVASL